MSIIWNNLLIWKGHVTMIKKDAYKINKSQLQCHSLTFIHKKTVPTATSMLSRSTMDYNTTASLEKLTCTDYVDFGKCDDRFRHFFWSQKDSIYLDVKLKDFRKAGKNYFQLVQYLTMGEADFKQFLRLRNQLVIQQKTLLERKTYPHCWYQHCPKTWMNNSSWLKRWLT